MKKVTATIEYKTGETITVRVGIATKIAYEKTAKVNQWTAEDNPFTLALFWAWHATKLDGRHSLQFDEWKETVLDIDVNHDETPDECPTSAAPTTSPQ